MALGIETPGRWPGHRDRAFLNERNVPIKGPKDYLLFHLLSEYSERARPLYMGQKVDSESALNLNLVVPTTVGNGFLLYMNQPVYVIL